MRIWRLVDPKDYRFARAGRVGTWRREEARGGCAQCARSHDRRVPPLVIEWLPGSALVGDFVWPGLNDDVAVTARVLRALEDRFTGFEGQPVEMVQDPKLRRPTRPTRRTRPRVWLPYDGPPLHDLWVTSWVHMDRERSTVTEIDRCEACGNVVRYQLEGIATWEYHRDEGRALKTLIPRRPGSGLYVRAEDLAGADVFRVHEFPGPIYCTDAVRHFIQEQRFTNVDFLETGEVV